jgi:predicted GIY-YIG superfamily endonuclease
MTIVEAPVEDEKTCVYRLHDADGRLLYVGATADIKTRWAGHRTEKKWWPMVDHERTKIAWYPDRLTALAAEMAAIVSERPLHNVVGFGNSRHRDPTVTARPTQQVKDQAAEILGASGITIQAYLLACLNELLAEPERRLREIAPYVPPPKQTGRPPKTRDTDTA